MEAVTSQLIEAELEKKFLIFADPSVVCCPDLPVFGANPVDVHFHDGLLHLDKLQTVGLGKSLLEALGGECSMPFTQCIAKAFDLGAPYVWFFKQLVWLAAGSLDRAVVLLGERSDGGGPMQVDTEGEAGTDDPMRDVLRTPSKADEPS